MRYLHWRQTVAPISLLGMFLIQYNEEKIRTGYFRIVVSFASHNGNFLSIVLTFKYKQTMDHQSIS